MDLMKQLERTLKRALKRTLKKIFKGWIGEKKSALTIWASLDNQTYRRFHNLIIPSDNGTAQIDHLLISSYGVFIVETKNKDGWIYGSEEKADWTQILFKEKYSFQNPLRQTYRQKKILANFIHINESYIYPIIYFVGDSNFKTKMPGNVLDSGLARYVKNFTQHVLSSEEVKRVINFIEQHQLNSNLTNTDHVRSLENRINSKTTCPNCGANLVTKTAKKGSNAGSQFLGCINYPRCKFTRAK
jgi:hypothetical protein